MKEIDDSPLYSFVLMISFSYCDNVFVCLFFSLWICLFYFFYLFLFFICFLVTFSLSLQSIFLCLPDEHRLLIALGLRTVQNRDSLVK